MSKEENVNKLRDVIVYICIAFMSNPLKLGAVKLNKTLWFSDVTALKKLKRTITGEYEYTAQPQGPVLMKIPPIMQKLGKEGLVSSTKYDFGDFQQWVYEITDIDKTLRMVETIEEKEKEILDEETMYAKGHTVSEVVKRAHNYSWWDIRTDGATIPVHLGHVK